MIRRFTGWHMAAIMVAFFAVVIGVNVTMARIAVGSFGGTVVENSYVASQRYNGWLLAARKQRALGWVPSVQVDGDGHVVIAVAGPSDRVTDARLSATATHPVGALPARALHFSATGGAYRSTERLPAGRWLIRLHVDSHGSSAAFDGQVTA